MTIKLALFTITSILLISCGNTPGKEKTAETSTGAMLVQRSDCFSCHSLKEQMVGPAYTDIAKRYTASPEVINTLSEKIIKGGSGNWGTTVMTPHPNVTKEDASAMVSYILSLKK